ncbi:lipid II flippase MurJ [Spirillospora sp. CA-294931]|uniref:lipid II flippase MurJ n=1 Tax=Spirillospora sp. CA-294931 TaxID=3240042 RepID=UPI003D947B2F
MTQTPLDRRPAPAPPVTRSIGRAATVSAVLVGTGTTLGFARDLTMAHLFGASGSTDAFLAAWTVPETFSPLLIEDAMALIMVPAVTRMLDRPSGVRSLVSTALPRLAAGLSLVTVLIILGAPYLVEAITPGLQDPASAVLCVRIAAVTVLTLGIAGFMSATLRAHHCFGPPASIYFAYNAGILAMLAALAAPLGITSAAIGVAVGSALMVAVQTPAFVRRLRGGGAPQAPAPAPAESAFLGVLAVVPVVAYTLIRQGQTLVERFFGSGLAAGSISHLNYAQKVAQVPMVLALLIVTVTFPRLARASASGDTDRVRRRIEADLVLVSGLILCATAYLVACSPQIVQVLFEHGRFAPDDTASTASILRVYALGLWGQTALGVCARAFFTQRRPMWHPALAMATGLAVTGAIAVTMTSVAGAPALAAANATGVTITAVLFVASMRARVVRISLRVVAVDLARLALAAAVACAAGLAVAGALAPAVPPALILLVNAAVIVAISVLVTGAGRSPATVLRALRPEPNQG